MQPLGLCIRLTQFLRIQPPGVGYAAPAMMAASVPSFVPGSVAQPYMASSYPYVMQEYYIFLSIIVT